MAKSKKSILSQRLKNEPHITDFVPGNELESSTGCYFGMGLSNKYGLSEQLPFDSIGLVLTTELVRQRAELERGFILVADKHAVNGTNSIGSVERIAKDRRDFIQRLLDKMSFHECDIILGSEIPRTEIIGTNGNRYENLQVGDMEFFRQRGSGIKIGWKHSMMYFDERHFDGVYTGIFGNVTSFVYTEPGRALDGTPAAPYLCAQKPRLIFSENEDLNYRVDHMPRKVRAYFFRLLDMYDKLACGHSGNGRNCPDKLKRRLKEVYSIVYGKAWI